jgi:hypothetical protein
MLMMVLSLTRVPEMSSHLAARGHHVNQRLRTRQYRQPILSARHFSRDGLGSALASMNNWPLSPGEHTEQRTSEHRVTYRQSTRCWHFSTNISSTFRTRHARD